MRNQKGFTLIELIIVIVVLGILAVTAAPQFINFSSDARASALKGMEGSVKGAMQLAYSKAAIEGEETSGTATVSVKGTDVNLVFGYPDASATGIINAVDAGFATDLGSDWVYEVVTGTPNTVVMAQSSSVTGTGTDGAYDSGDIATSECYLTYTAAADEETAAIIAVTEDSGC
ncbi:type II secretion system protein [Idiomarina sp.]|uniref:type II secretion system protein n=1 Tax=Idiomarina sp. TaxID=1874361 RepID=UPI003A958BD9